jgi:hypothetical protein
MKSKILLAVLSLFGCTSQPGDPLTDREKEQIRSEVKEAAQYLMTGWAALDGTIAIKSFSPEMVSCYEDQLLDYESYRKSWTVFTEARASIRITPIREDYIILTEDHVIDTWVGQVEEIMKTGEKVTYNPIRFTNVFRKSNGEWKIIFAQSSGIPVIAAPGK